LAALILLILAIVALFLIPKNKIADRRREEFRILEEVCREHGVNSDHIKVLMELGGLRLHSKKLRLAEFHNAIVYACKGNREKVEHS